jgi:PhzF family phenazine biosynthesis protein
LIDWLTTSNPPKQTQTKFHGNPLALVFIPAGHDPPTETLQTIAREFNLSETAFLYLNDETNNKENQQVPAWRARIFMIDAELPFAGHPTIGTACYALGTLLQGGGTKTGRLQIPAGTVEANFANGVAKAAIPHNVHLHAESAFSVEMLEGLQPSLRGGGGVLRIDVMSPVRGMNFVCVELESLEVLGLVGCTGKRPTAKLDGEWDVGFVGALFYVKTGEGDGEDGRKVVRVRSRMIEGVMEDPATGSAACALGGLSDYAGCWDGEA